LTHYAMVGLYQGSILSLLLFMIAMEIIIRELRTRLLLELLYADDLILMPEGVRKVCGKTVQ